MSARGTSLASAPLSLWARCKRWDRGAGVPLPRQAAVEIERLWTLVALQDSVRARKLEFMPLATVGQRLGVSTCLEELFGSSRSYREVGFEGALALASTNIAERYRHVGSGGRLMRIQDRLRALLDFREETDGSCARCLLLPAPGPDVSVSLWELPAREPMRPYRHAVEGLRVLVLLEGRATLRGTARARHLRKDQAAIVAPGGDELLNESGKRVRFLLFESTVS